MVKRKRTGGNRYFLKPLGSSQPTKRVKLANELLNQSDNLIHMAYRDFALIKTSLETVRKEAITDLCMRLYGIAVEFNSDSDEDFVWIKLTQRRCSSKSTDDKSTLDDCQSLITSLLCPEDVRELHTPRLIYCLMKLTGFREAIMKMYQVDIALLDEADEGVVCIRAGDSSKLNEAQSKIDSLVAATFATDGPSGSGTSNENDSELVARLLVSESAESQSTASRQDLLELLQSCEPTLKCMIRELMTPSAVKTELVTSGSDDDEPQMIPLNSNANKEPVNPNRIPVNPHRSIPQRQTPCTSLPSSSSLPGTSLGPGQQRPPRSASVGKRHKRPVIIDGMNVGHAFGRNTFLGLRGVLVAYLHFAKLGHDVQVYLPRQLSKESQLRVEDHSVRDSLRKHGVLREAPGRKNPLTGRFENCYDDYFVVKAAADTQGVILSNDQYRDLFTKHAELRTTISERLLSFEFADDSNLILPPDPRGRVGPSLEDFMHFPVGVNPPRAPDTDDLLRQMDELAAASAPTDPAPPTTAMTDGRRRPESTTAQSTPRNAGPSTSMPRPNSTDPCLRIPVPSVVGGSGFGAAPPSFVAGQDAAEKRSADETKKLRLELLTLFGDAAAPVRLIDSALRENEAECSVDVIAEIVLDRMEIKEEVDETMDIQ